MIALGLVCSCLLFPPAHRVQNSSQQTSYDSSQQLRIKAPGSRFETATPLPGAPSITVDTYMDGDGIAKSIARNRNLQARIMWIDATANINNYNTEGKIIALCQQLRDSGFNTIVLDIKPISGQTIYPSQYAPKLQSWRGQNLPVDFDPLAIFSREAKADHLSLIVSMNAFSEGHQLFHVGPGYDHPDEQSVLYEPKIEIQSPLGAVYPCLPQPNVTPTDASAIGVFNNAAKLPPPSDDEFAVTLGPGNVVVDGFADGGTGKGVPTIPKGGAVLVGTGLAADFLKNNATPGLTLKYQVVPNLVPIGERPNREYPLMMNPNDPRVVSRMLDMVREVASRYPINGLMFDDRLRFAGLDGDFSNTTREQFESFVGHSVDWPTSVYSYTVHTDYSTGIIPGPEFDAWLAFRALTVRNFLAQVRGALNAVRPGIKLGDYSGSWYGEYDALGSNWASNKFRAGFWYLTPSYQQTGFASLLDFLITGCYYPTATVHEALALGTSPGSTVEAAGALTNRATRDACWSYAGISLTDFTHNPGGLMNALSAACATTEGVMVFDLSDMTTDLWPLFKQAFSAPKFAPQDDSVGLALVRRMRDEEDKAHERTDPVIIMNGSTGVGQ